MTDNELQAIFSDGIESLKWLLNHADESPRKQVGGLMECFTIEDNHTTKVYDHLRSLTYIKSEILDKIAPTNSKEGI